MLTTEQAFFVDLLSPDRPHPGHGFRVNAFGSRYNDVQTLVHGSLEDRAQLGKRQLEMDLLSLHVVGDDRVPWLHPWTGTEVFAAAFGCEVHRPGNEMPSALPIVGTANEADRLKEPSMSQGPLGEVFTLADRLVELCGSGYPVRICDIQSPLDIAALIWEKSAFYVALYEEPAAVHRLLRKITDTLLVFVRAFLDRYRDVCLVHWPDLWMPSEWGICVSEDEIGSISAETYREFGLPYLKELGEAFGGISLHSCASGQHQWQNIETLPGIRFLNLSHPAVDLQASIERFSGRVVLVPVVFPGLEYGLDFVDECLALARPDTRFYFRTDVDGLDQAVELAGQFRRRCGREPAEA